MKKYIPLMVLALALSGPSLGYAQDAKPASHVAILDYTSAEIRSDSPGNEPSKPDAKPYKEDKATTTAVNMLRTAAEHGSGYASFLLALAYDGDAAVEGSLLRDGQVIFLQRDDKKALDWLRKSADLGFPDAQYDMGFVYHKGLWGVKKDEKEAVKWLGKAADQNFCSAQAEMGIAYYNGWGVKKDLKEARSRWLKAGALDYLQQYTGMKIPAGRDATKCLNEGTRVMPLFDMYRKAAEQGNAEAQYRMGEIYHGLLVNPDPRDEGVRKDDKEAVNWWRKAAAQGNVAAQESLDQLMKK